MIYKDEAREIIQARLTAVSETEYIAASRSAYGNVKKMLESLLPITSSFSVLLYAANPAWREVPLDEIKNAYRHFHCDYALPQKDAPLPNKTYDVICVPLFGFRLDGYRLGRGGGWYDRMLALQPQALKIGIGLSQGCIDFSVDSHDIPMDILVTEQGITTPRPVDIPAK